MHENSKTYDAIIVGGGIVGISIAYHLVHQKVDTLLFDRKDQGRATNAGAGILFLRDSCIFIIAARLTASMLG